MADLRVNLDFPNEQITFIVETMGKMPSLGQFLFAALSALYRAYPLPFQHLYREADVERAACAFDNEYQQIISFYYERPFAILERVNPESYAQNPVESDSPATLQGLLAEMPHSLGDYLVSGVPLIMHPIYSSPIVYPMQLDIALQQDVPLEILVHDSGEVHLFRPDPERGYRDNVYARDPKITSLIEGASLEASKSFSEYLAA